MSRCTARKPKRMRGFTLIELLVVMTMLSLIMVGTGQAFHSMGQTEQRIDSRLQRNDQIRVVTHFLQSALGRLNATTTVNPNTKEKQSAHFLAQPQSISWVGIMPARPGAGGLHFFRLAIEDLHGGGKGLVMRYKAWTAQNTFPDWDQAEAQVLVKQVSELQVMAQGLPRKLSDAKSDWPQSWQAGWPMTKELPQRLSLRLQDSQGPWPPITVTLYPTVSSEPISGGFVSGGSR